MADFMPICVTSGSSALTSAAGKLCAVDRSGTRFRDVVLNGAVLRGVELVSVDVCGEVENLTVNGVNLRAADDLFSGCGHADGVNLASETSVGEPTRRSSSTIEVMDEFFLAYA
jgi:hypothetical protein